MMSRPVETPKMTHATLKLATLTLVTTITAAAGNVQAQGAGHMGHAMPATGHVPVPALTDADRQAAFLDGPGHTVHDKGINYQVLLDRLEWQDADHGSALKWDGSAWFGGDINRLWLNFSGERNNGVTEQAEIQALWGHSFSPWWDVVAGVRQDFKPGSPQTWATLGMQGTPWYGIDSEATVFFGENGQTAARFIGEYEMLLTNRLILQPAVEINFHGKNDPARGVGAGLSTTEVGLRLRYEIRRELAPYIGVTWVRSYGNTADFARDEGEDSNDVRFVAGVRLWF